MLGKLERCINAIGCCGEAKKEERKPLPSSIIPEANKQLEAAIKKH